MIRIKNVTRFITGLALVLGLLLSACWNQSAGAGVVTPGNCKWDGSVNMWGTVGEDVSITLGEGMPWYPTRVCNADGARVFHTVANNRYEFFELKNIYLDAEYDKRFGLPLVYCVTEERRGNYLMGEASLFDYMKISEHNKRRWNSFAQAWVKKHSNCKLGN